MTKAGTRVPAYPRQTKEVINTSKKNIKIFNKIFGSLDYFS